MGLPQSDPALLAALAELEAKRAAKAKRRAANMRARVARRVRRGQA